MDTPKQKFLTHEEYNNVSEGPISDRTYSDPDPYTEVAETCKKLSDIAQSGDGLSHISVPRELKRQRVVNAFNDAFELIGGVPRLAHWGDSHPTDFFKLFARMLPAEMSKKVHEVEERVVIHVLPKGPLDEEG